MFYQCVNQKYFSPGLKATKASTSVTLTRVAPEPQFQAQYAPMRQPSFNSLLQRREYNYICADLTTELRSGEGERNEREERGKV